MSADSTADAGIDSVRRELLRDRANVTRTGPMSDDLDPITGLPVSGTPTTVFSDLPCWFDSPGVVGSRITAAGDVTTMQKPKFSTDVTVALQVGDIVTCTASRTASNVGRRMRISAVPVSTFGVRQSYEVEVITG